MADPAYLLVTDSITRLEQPAGKVIVAASHAGIYAAHLGALAGARAVILNDASVGRDAAGIGGLAHLERFGMAAAAIAHDSARIGDGADMLARGRIAHVNAPARALGVTIGMSCRDAAAALAKAEIPKITATPLEETRVRVADGVFAIDSASLVQPDDKDNVLITGSHGGLLGGKPETALKYPVRAVLYHDAGIGADGAGITRLPALAARGIPAGTVSAASARIGDAKSCYEDGVISHVNDVAARAGALPGMTARDFVALFTT